MGPFNYQCHGGEGAAFPEKMCVMKVYGSKLLALRGVSNSLEKNRYVTLQWPRCGEVRGKRRENNRN